MTALATGAFLALWNGVNDAALRDEYEAWHAFEHVPERVGSPGFAWARRYVALPGQPGPAYFTLYGLDSLDALQTARYQALLDEPTPWSARMRGVLSDFCREPCEAQSFHGVSAAAFIAPLRVRVHSRSRVAQVLAALVDAGHALSAGWGAVDRASGHPLSAPHTQAASEPGFDAVILLQHLREGLLLSALAALQRMLGGEATLRAPASCYALQSSVRQSDLMHPLAQRQPPRPELRQRFIPGDLAP